MSERLQKVMAHSGYGSRRTCEEMIRSGRVLVNGVKPKLGDKVDPTQDEILVDGRIMDPPEALEYILLHKPTGYLSSTRSQGGVPTVLELVSSPRRIYPVGRLDLDSEGLLLMTNDGQLTHRLTHPRYNHEKEYQVLLDRYPNQDQINRWEDGVVLSDGYRTQPIELGLAGDADGGYLVKIVLTEGRKRQIRDTAAALGLEVIRLIRVRMASLQLGDLPCGKWRLLETDEILELKRHVKATG